MTTAHDIYSETNPAFCAYVLTAFVEAYSFLNAEGPEVPLVYLAIPLSLSGDLAVTFQGSNKNTGLLTWLQRNPRIQVALAARLNASTGVITEAVRFACFSRVVVLDERARLLLGPDTIEAKATRMLSSDLARAHKHAQRLGHWFAATGSTRAVFDFLGLTV